jgi:hypothetical protein
MRISIDLSGLKTIPGHARRQEAAVDLDRARGASPLDLRQRLS